MAPSAQVVGRDHELATIDAFLEAIPAGASVLSIEGDAGIGKSVLWGVAVARGRELGFVVVSARPAEAESKFGYSVLADLLAPILSDSIGSLPEPQRRALQVALLQEDPGPRAPLPRSVAAGTAALTSTVSIERPLLIAIDDVQWTDRASASALAFAIRRSGSSPVGILTAQRQEAVGADPLHLRSAFPGTFRRIRLRPLSSGALANVLALRLGVRLPRAAVMQVYRACRGNPLWGLELGRAIRDGELEMRPGEPLGAPVDLEGTLRRRLSRLSPAGRQLVLAVASLASPDVRTIEEAFGEKCLSAIDQTVELGILTIDADRLRFSHPLLASTAYWMARPSERRRFHRALASVVRSKEERARHLALSVDGSDESVASALDEAAADARARGAPEAAAELARLASLATPPNDNRARSMRLVEGAWSASEAGDREEAWRLANEAVACAPSGPSRARALAVLALCAAGRLEEGTASTAFEEALEHASDDPELAAEIHLLIATAAPSGPAGVARHTERAAELLEGSSEAPRDLHLLAATQLAQNELLLGRGVHHGYVQRARALAVSGLQERSRASWLPPWMLDVETQLIYLWVGIGDLDRARAALESSCDQATQLGSEAYVVGLRSVLVQVELRAGRWDRADEHARFLARAAELEPAVSSITCLAAEATCAVAAHQGQVDRARRDAAVALAIAEDDEAHDITIGTLSSLGLAELSAGDPRRALALLSRADGLVHDVGYGEPGLWSYHGDLVEALIQCGDSGRAEAVVVELERQGSSLERPYASVVAARGRGMLYAVAGDRDNASGAFQRAMQLHDRLEMPYERARTLLIYGSALRRSRKWAGARAALVESLSMFDELGAQLFADRCRSELLRVGGRRPGSNELTETELRIAAAVAEGLSTREAADRMFLSPRTVESALASIYRKLGIHSRAELGRVVRSE